jgi:hypothetical protein
MEIEDETVIETSKIDKIKQHIKDNKKIYIGTATIVVVGIAAFVLGRKSVKRTIVTSELSIFNEIDGDYNTLISNTYQQTVSKYGYPLGRPGKPVFNVDTGRDYASESYAAIDVGVSQKMMSDHLHGKRESVNGKQFKFKEAIEEAI